MRWCIREFRFVAELGDGSVSKVVSGKALDSIQSTRTL